MILVKLTNTLTIGLAFSHPWKNEATGVLVKDERTGLWVQDVIKVRHTRCEILEVQGDPPYILSSLPILAVATTRCDPRDNFCKETGRKISLRQAIKVLHPPLSKEDREWVWGEYLDRPRPKSTPPPEVVENLHAPDCSSWEDEGGACTCLEPGKTVVPPTLSLEEVEEMITKAIPVITTEDGLTGG